MAFESLDKLKHYLVMLSLKPDGDFVPPEYLGVARSFWSDFTCPSGCGGCCPSHSIDYFEDEWQQFCSFYPEQVQYFSPIEAEFFGKKVPMWSNRVIAESKFKNPFPLNKCIFLSDQARCNVHLANPFSCRFELNKLDINRKYNRVLLKKRLYGWGWNYLRLDGGRGAYCEILPVTLQTIEIVKSRDIPMLESLVKRLENWGIPHRGWKLLELLETQYLILKEGGDIKNITLLRQNEVELTLW